MPFEEWACSCGKRNYIGRSSCKKCGINPPEDVVSRRKEVAPTPQDVVEALMLRTLREMAGNEEQFVPKHKIVEDPPAFLVESKLGSDGSESQKIEKEVTQCIESEAILSIQEAVVAPLSIEAPNVEVLPLVENEEPECEDPFEKNIVVAAVSTDCVPPGTIKVVSIAETSFGVLWEPLLAARYAHITIHDFRIVLFDDKHQTMKVDFTSKKNWHFFGLDHSNSYSVAVTCRARIVTMEGHPGEDLRYFFIPETTIKASVTLDSTKEEIAYFFDGQANSIFARCPWRLYYGTVQEGDGSIIQESKLGSITTNVRYGVRGNPETPGAAYKGVTALEIYAPYSLGAGAVADIEVKENHRSIYEIECWVLQLPPVPEDYENAPLTIKSLAKAANMARKKCQKLEAGLPQTNELSKLEVPGLVLNSKLTPRIIDGPDAHKSPSFDNKSCNDDTANIFQGPTSLDSPDATGALELSTDNSWGVVVSSAHSVESFSDSKELKHVHSVTVTRIQDLPKVGFVLGEHAYDRDKSSHQELTLGVNGVNVNPTADLMQFETKSDSLFPVDRIASVSLAADYQDDVDEQEPSCSENVPEPISLKRFESAHLIGSEKPRVTNLSSTGDCDADKAFDDESTNALENANADVKRLESEMLAGGTFLHVRDKDFKASWVSSNGATKFGEWEKISLRTHFPGNRMKVHIQTRASGFSSVLVDAFRVRYISPSELEMKLTEVREAFKAHTSKELSPYIDVGISCAEDLLTANGSFYKGTVMATVYWRGVFIAQTDIGYKGGRDPILNGMTRLPCCGSKWVETSISKAKMGLEVRVVDAFGFNLVGELKISAIELYTQPAGAQFHNVRIRNAKKRSCPCVKSKVAPSVETLFPNKGSEASLQDEEKKYTETNSVVDVSKLEEGDFKEIPKFDPLEVVDVHSNRGRIVLTVSRADPSSQTPEHVSLIECRDKLLKRDKKGSRQLIRLIRSSRSDLAELDFKNSLLRLGVVDAAVAMLNNETFGPISAEILIEFLKMSNEVIETRGGLEYKRLIRTYLHEQGVARATFMLGRSRARKMKYMPSKLKRGQTLIPVEHLQLLVCVYSANRQLLLNAIVDQLGIFEMIVRSCTSGSGDKEDEADTLLCEIGLGKTLPAVILNDFLRLRSIIPLNEKYWRCEALRALPATLPPRLMYIFDPDRLACLPPEQPEMSRWERLVKSSQIFVYWLFVFACFCGLLMALYSRFVATNCALTLPALILPCIIMTTLFYVSSFARMVRIGVGSQAAVCCLPSICCNFVGIVGLLCWEVLVLYFFKSSDLEKCSVAFIWVNRGYLGFIGLLSLFSVLQTIRMQLIRAIRCIVFTSCLRRSAR